MSLREMLAWALKALQRPVSGTNASLLPPTAAWTSEPGPAAKIYTETGGTRPQIERACEAGLTNMRAWDAPHACWVARPDFKRVHMIEHASRRFHDASGTLIRCALCPREYALYLRVPPAHAPAARARVRACYYYHTARPGASAGRADAF